MRGATRQADGPTVERDTRELAHKLGLSRKSFVYGERRERDTWREEPGSRITQLPAYSHLLRKRVLVAIVPGLFAPALDFQPEILDAEPGRFLEQPVDPELPFSAVEVPTVAPPHNRLRKHPVPQPRPLAWLPGGDFILPPLIDPPKTAQPQSNAGECASDGQRNCHDHDDHGPT